MGQRLLVSRYAVMMDAADTFIIWRLILPIGDADSVSVCWMNAWRVCGGSGSSASLSWWRTIIRAAANFGSAAAGKRSPALSRWELIFRSQKRVASKLRKRNSLEPAQEGVRVEALWETAKAETTLGNARHAAKRRSASRSQNTSRRRASGSRAGKRQGS